MRYSILLVCCLLLSGCCCKNQPIIWERPIEREMLSELKWLHHWLESIDKTKP